MTSGIKEKLRSIIYIEESGSSKKKLNKGLLILLIVGVSLLLFSSFFSSEVDDEPPAPEDISYQGIASMPDLERKSNDLEKEISNILNQIKGISDASVFLTIDTSSELILADASEGSSRKTLEEDSGGGVREIEEDTWKDSYVIMRDSQGGEKPLVLYERKEQYRGVLVVANGVEDPWLKTQIIEALSSLLGLPNHRITVLPR